MLKSILPLFVLILTLQPGYAQSTADKSDIYCSIYRSFDGNSWDLLKTEGLSLKPAGSTYVSMAVLPETKGSALSCGVGRYNANMVQTYEGVRCSYDGQNQFVINTTLKGAQQSGVEAEVKDFSGNQFLVRCEANPPLQQQALVLYDFAYVGEAEKIMRSIQQVTGGIGKTASLKTGEGLFELSCEMENSSTKCTAQILPKIWTDERQLLVGIKGIDADNMGIHTGLDFVRLEFKSSADLSLLKEFLDGKSEWRSESEVTINKFGGETEQLPSVELQCKSGSCVVTLNDYLLTNR